MRGALGAEEELYACGRTAVWSRGGASHAAEKVVVCCYSADTPVRHALWCTFHCHTPSLTADVEAETALANASAAAAAERLGHTTAAGAPGGIPPPPPPPPPPPSATVGTSSGHLADEPEEPPYETQLPCVCIVDSETIQAFTLDGEDYTAALQFQVSAVWPCLYGLILERGASMSPPSSPSAIPGFTSFNSSTGTDGTTTGSAPLPTVFSLSHPLDEMVPIVAKHGLSVSVMNDSCQKIVFTCEIPSILMLYDSNTGLHSVWKIRKATLDERQAVLVSSNTSSAANSSSLGTTVGSNIGSATGSPNSAHGRLSLGRGGIGRVSECTSQRNSGSPFGPSRNNSIGSSSVASGVHSPFQTARESWTQSLRTTLGSLSALNQLPVHSVLMQHSMNMAGRHTSWGGGSDTALHASGLGLPDSRLMTSQVVDVNQKARPLLASICLEHLWSENSGTPREGPAGPASKVFLTTDLVGNSFLCYLVPAVGQLSLARLKYSNHEKQLIFGAVSSLPAKDAASLPLLNMIAMVEPMGGVVLYSGLTFVGKVHVAGIPSSLATSSYLAGFGSPFPKRSSLVASSRPASALDPLPFEDELHQLSPVATLSPQLAPLAPGTTPTNPRSTLGHLRLSGALAAAGVRLRLDSEGVVEGDCAGGLRKGQLVALRDAVDKRVTLELSDGSMFRISLPDLCSSALVLECLGVLKRVLPKDLAMQLLVRWYAARNAPGTQDISPNHEWHLFIRLLFELCGYEVEKLTLARGPSEGDLTNIVGSDSTPHGGSVGSTTSGINGISNGSAAAKKKRASDAGSEDDWEYLVRSELHVAVGPGLTNMLGLRRAPPPPTPVTASPTASTATGRVNVEAPLLTSLPLITYSLHLLYEELKLNALLSESMPMLAMLLHQLAGDLQLNAYCQHYWRDFPLQCTPLMNQVSQLSAEELHRLPSFQLLGSEPPDLCQHIFWLTQGIQPPPFPYISSVNPRTRDIVQLAALVTHGAQMPRIQLESFVRHLVPPGTCVEAPSVLSTRDSAPSATYPFPQRAVLLMTEMGITRRELQTLPAGVALLLSDVLHRCRQSPPTDWPRAAYELILRQDLAALSSHAPPPTSTHACGSSSPTSNNGTASGGTPTATVAATTGGTANTPGGGAAAAAAAAGAASAAGKSAAAAAAARAPDSEEEDGMETVDSEILRLRFSQDHRVAEVRRLLQSSQPVRIDIAQRPEVSDHEFIEEQERHLYGICTRTMALPVGRGMFTLRTAVPVVTEALPIPRLCLTGRAPPRGTTVDLSHIEVVPNMNMWPLFHNGVAAGLRVVPHAPDIESSWIVYNKPKGTQDVSTEHAGFLMALGLNGHLGNLARWNAYEYLAKCHEMTSVGLLLGVAANKRGTMDITTTKMLSLHLEALLPPTSIELDIQQNVQVAALLGVGLVYQGTAHRRMAEVLLSEIGRPPGPEMENSVDRESYSLAAGLALGLVVLGRASHLSGLGDLQIPDTLHYYMVGGHKRPFTGSQKEKYKSPSYQIREGDQVSIDVTSPGATLALGMMFFNSGNRAVADWMQAPSTQYLLDFVRPDFLLLRIVARALILWEEVRPTSTWVESNVPASIRPYCLVKPQPSASTDCVDYETMNQAYCNILAGACMALGLRYAGSANQDAFTTLMTYARMFTSLSGKSIAELAGKSTIETCLNVILLSLAMVMAGSGDLEVLRLCRRLRARCGPAGAGSVVTYGSHLATHMALGLLFLGGGRCTLATSPPAVAAMLCAFFPKFPTHSNDNRYHLQAFRHLYVLAVEARLLLPRDIDTRQLCYAHLRLLLQEPGDDLPKELRVRAPAVLPELSRLHKVIVEDDRYWTIEFNRNSNWAQLENVLHSSGCVDVKQRAGCLSYLEDPQGFRTMLAETLTLDPAISWSVKAESISAFSSDPSVVNFAKHFLERLEDEEDDGTSISEKEQIQTLTRLVYECMTQDKLAILPIWITLQKAVQSLSMAPCSFLTWQLKLVTSQVLHLETVLGDGSNAPMPLVSPELALALHQRVTRIFNSWEAELEPYLRMYLRGQYPSDVQILRKLTSYVIYHDIPPLHVLQPLLGKMVSPLGLRSLLMSRQPTIGTLSKLACLLD